MTIPRPVPGAPAPVFSLVAAGSGREVGTSTSAGRSLVLVFHSQNTTLAVDRLNRGLRERFPAPTDPTIASVVDLSLVPPPFRLPAQMALDASYRAAASSLPPDADPSDYVVILGDWTGRVTRSYRAAGAYLVPVVVVVGRDGTILGRVSGTDIAATVLLLEEQS